MDFKNALEAMKHGEAVKLPSWGGFWRWDAEKRTIIMHTKEGKEMDIRETQVVEYTLLNVLSDEWVIAGLENCPALGGIARFSFSEAIKFVKRGMKVRRARMERTRSAHRIGDRHPLLQRHGRAAAQCVP